MAKTYIIAESIGRLGNIFVILSALNSIAKKLNATPILFCNSFDDYISLKKYNLSILVIYGWIHHSLSINKLTIHIAKEILANNKYNLPAKITCRYYKERLLSFEENDNSNFNVESTISTKNIDEITNYIIKKYSANNNIYLFGTWQENSLIFENPNSFFKQFILPNKFFNKMDLILKNNFQTENSVAIHIRRDDYLNPLFLYSIGLCSNAYFKSAIKNILLKVKNPKFYLFTDQPQIIDSLNNQINDKNIKINLVSNINRPDYIDFALFSYCKHHIISNSTFSIFATILSNHIYKDYKYIEQINIIPSSNVNDGSGIMITIPNAIKINRYNGKKFNIQTKNASINLNQKSNYCLIIFDNSLILKSLPSIFNQSLLPDSIFVISKDKSISKEINAHNKNIKVICFSNLNVALKAVKSPFIAFLNGGDIWYKRKMKSQISQIIEKQADYNIANSINYNITKTWFKKKVFFKISSLVIKKSEVKKINQYFNLPIIYLEPLIFNYFLQKANTNFSYDILLEVNTDITNEKNKEISNYKKNKYFKEFKSSNINYSKQDWDYINELFKVSPNKILPKYSKFSIFTIDSTLINLIDYFLIKINKKRVSIKDNKIYKYFAKHIKQILHNFNIFNPVKEFLQKSKLFNS